MEKYLSLDETAEHFGVSLSTVQRWRKRGCPHLKQGKVIRFLVSEVVAWMEEADNG